MLLKHTPMERSTPESNRPWVVVARDSHIPNAVPQPGSLVRPTALVRKFRTSKSKSLPWILHFID